jgi:hypothetical protein
MNRDTPEGLSLEVRNVVIPLRDALVEPGWTFGSIQWDGTGPEHKLSFSAKSAGGASVYMACHENSLPEKLQALLDTS